MAASLGPVKHYHENSGYVKNILSANVDHIRPSNCIYADIFEFLIRNHHEKTDFSVEGCCLVETVVKHLMSIGYEKTDSINTVQELIDWNLIEPESLVVSEIQETEPVLAHISGFIHMRFFNNQPEYIIGVTPDCAFANEVLAREIGNAWGSGTGNSDLNLKRKVELIQRIADNIQDEYDGRVGRHAFYGSKGFGGATLLRSVALARGSFEKIAEAWRG